MLTCKASTYCHILSAGAESCEKRVYLLFATPPHRDAKLKMCLATAAHNFKLLKIKSQHISVFQDIRNILFLIRVIMVNTLQILLKHIMVTLGVKEI